MPAALAARYEVIVCYYAWCHRLLRLDRFGAKVIVDLGDVMADRHERIGTRRWISLARKDEEGVVHSHNRVVAISEDDRVEFERLYGRKLPVVPFVPREHASLTALAASRPKRLGFFAAPSYLNEEVAAILASPVFLNRLRAGGIELLIAGGICKTLPDTVRTQLEGGGARIVGAVASVEDFYREVGSVLNPVGPSTGVKIKSVETLVSGRSLITTQWGVDAALKKAFGGQIHLVDWPIDPAALADVALDALAIGNVEDLADSTNAYARLATEAWQSVLR